MPEKKTKEEIEKEIEEIRKKLGNLNKKLEQPPTTPRKPTTTKPEQKLEKNKSNKKEKKAEQKTKKPERKLKEKSGKKPIEKGKKETKEKPETEKPKEKPSEEKEIKTKQKIIKQEQTPVSEEKKKQGILESYDIDINGSKVNIEIKKQSSGIFYNLNIPEISDITNLLLDEIRTELIASTAIGMSEIMDPNAFESIKKKFMQESSVLLKEKMPTIKPEMQKFLIGKLMQEMMGLGKIEFLVNDSNLEEIVIPTSKESIRVYYKKYGWLITNLKIGKEEEILNYSNIIARRVGRQINVLIPLLDAHLISGDRVNAIQFPISTKGNTITIRKFARDPYTIVDLINNQTCDLDTSVLLWLAIEYEMNVLISGGTASGKTVLLNACMPFIPPNHRIISVEDTRELMLPEFLYWTPLVTRIANAEGKGEVSMLDLLVNSLRMRPDRIVLGEMRRQEEAMVLFEAMHTGHSVYATLHADSATETVSRLTNPPLNVPPNLLKAVNLNVVMFRDRRKGLRRIFQIAEFESDPTGATANILYRWVPETDKIIRHSESSRFFEDMSRHTGLSQSEIEKNLAEKKEILEWLLKNNIRELNKFGKVMNIYYTNKELLFKELRNNNLKKILEQ